MLFQAWPPVLMGVRSLFASELIIDALIAVHIIGY